MNYSDILNFWFEQVSSDNWFKKDVIATKSIILAIPQLSLLKMPYILRNKYLKSILNSVSSQPLYRIYAKFPTKQKKNGGDDSKVWFSDIPKICTNLPAKYIIPYDYSKGIIMISYTDGLYAKNMLNQYTRSISGPSLGEDKNAFWNSVLKPQMSKLFQEEIPTPEWIKHYYWNMGAAYWKPRVDSTKLVPLIVNPLKTYKNLYICGENYSHHQAWMEGAIQTSNMVLDKIAANYNDITAAALSESNSQISKQVGGGSAHHNVSETRKHKPGNIKNYSLEDVKKHNKKSDAWIAINNGVYDITSWIPNHPGGDIIMRGVGRNATKLFETIGHSSHAKSILSRYKIGILHE
jgi:cytochrome b involved in lipid metabolism